MTESFVYGSPAAGDGDGDGEDQSGAVDDTVETVGESDAQADAARTGADGDAGGLDGPSFGQAAEATDTDGEAVGTADADADALRSGVDPDDR